MTNDQIEELARAMALSDGYDPDETWQEFDRCAALSMDYSGAPLDPDWENKVFPTFTRWAEYVPKAEAIAPIIDRWASEARELGPVNICEAPEAAAMRYIEALRSDFGTVTILPDNEEAETRDQQMAIDCCGEWTNWQDQRFYGETVLQCLSRAVGVREKSLMLKGSGHD